MCGINGIFAYRGGIPVDRTEVLASRDRMHTRGPDGAGFWLSGDCRIGLGHRRLAIIDLSEAAAQPMHSSDGRLTIVYNGEIYNYRELRAELERDGGSFASHSDTEVLLHLYARYGDAMVQHLRGMFAFAIWDRDVGRLFLARDPHGIKPLYWSNSNGVFRFASQVQALLAGGALPREVAPAGLVGFLLWGSVPEPLSFYRSIRALPAGSTFNVDSNGVSKVKSYWRVGDAIVRSQQTAENIPAGQEREAVRAALLDSVRAHLVADVPVGAFMSAGLDSSTLVGLAHEAGHDIQTFTVSADEFRGRPADEAPMAAEIARHFGVPNQVSSLTLDDAQKGVPAFLNAMDQPTMDGINTWFVTEATRSAGLKVALSGVGGDELLGGYSTFSDIPDLARRLQGWAQRPHLAAAMGQGHAIAARFFRRLKPRDGECWRGAGDLHSAYRWKRGLFMPWELTYLVQPEVLHQGLEMLAGEADPDPVPAGLDTFCAVATLESTRYMRNQLLRDADWVGMAHSLELRTPLVDRRVTETIVGLAAAGRLGKGKGILASILRNGLPKAALQRPKTGFTLPIWRWLHQLETLSAWKRNTWMQRRAHGDYNRWAYAVAARLPETNGMFI